MFGMEPESRTIAFADPRDRLLSGTRMKRLQLNQAAWMVLQHQPQDGDIVFPYQSKSICVAFSRACSRLTMGVT
jgi:hypothetical protein